ncbi:MAG TPA: hypothetical protein VMW75_19395, partial [Thermoanaerobaculia bacterium]|nr:hypothetical protein [Thermoanaerobaculia bacterium]
IGAGGIVLVLIVQSVAGKYAGQAQEVWGWALPTFLPTLALMVAVLGAGALEPVADTTQVRGDFYVLALWLSRVYVALIVGIILVEPLSPLEPLALYKLSGLWLAPFQGLVTSAIGVLFFTRQR